MACPEMERLQQQYRRALAAYWEMVTLLDNVSSFCDFEEAYELAEGVRLLFDRARVELHEHIEQHGCTMAGEASNEIARR